MAEQAINKEEILEIILEGQKRIKESKSMPRSYSKDLLEMMPSKPIKIVTGFRRAGKSTIIKEVCQKLVRSKKYALKNILYLNFEDLQQRNIDKRNLSKISLIFFLKAVLLQNY